LAKELSKQIAPRSRSGALVKAQIKWSRHGFQYELQPDDLWRAHCLAFIDFADRMRKCRTRRARLPISSPVAEIKSSVTRNAPPWLQTEPGGPREGRSGGRNNRKRGTRNDLQTRWRQKRARRHVFQVWEASQMRRVSHRFHRQRSAVPAITWND